MKKDAIVGAFETLASLGCFYPLLEVEQKKQLYSTNIIQMKVPE